MATRTGLDSALMVINHKVPGLVVDINALCAKVVSALPGMAARLAEAVSSWPVASTELHELASTATAKRNEMIVFIVLVGL